MSNDEPYNEVAGLRRILTNTPLAAVLDYYFDYSDKDYLEAELIKFLRSKLKCDLVVYDKLDSRNKEI